MYNMKTKHPEEDYKELARLGQKLGLPVPQVFLSLEVTKDGKVLETYKDRSRTWNRNFWNYTMVNGCGGTVGATFGAGSLIGKFRAGSLQDIPIYNFHSLASAGSDIVGIVPGRGSGAEDFEGYNLTTPITHGTGANQFSFLVEVAPVPTYDAPSLTWTANFARVYNNNSGGNITVTEVAYLYSQGFMMCRDLLSVPQLVVNGAQLTITYTMTLQMPA